MNSAFLEQDPVMVAERLIGCHLIRKTQEGVIRVQITETEAYRGSDDPASHAFRGMTPRNQLMFGDVGRLYVYFIYGMHFCMNVVAHQTGAVGAVLLRAGHPLEGVELIQMQRPNVSYRNLLNGPGKLARGLQVDKSLNGYDLLQKTDNQLAIEQHFPVGVISKSTRIGITKGKEMCWRFHLSSDK